MITQIKARAKVNFMLNKSIIQELQTQIPEGQRSNFVNSALEDALKRFKCEKAFTAIDAFRNKMHFSMSTKEIIALKNYGRN